MIERSLRALDSFFERLPGNAILLLCLLIAVGIGILDHFLGPELLILYLGPIFIAGWYSSFGQAAVVAIYSAASAYITATVLSSTVQLNATELTNLFVRLVSYLIIAKIISKLREARRQTSFIIHDLRAPISNAISGLMTVQQSGQTFGETDREMVDLALVSNQRALALVNSLLDMSKLESGKFDVSQERVSLERFFDDCFHQVELWAKANRVQLCKKLLVNEAVLDPTLTTRVVVNLLSNALKFSPAGGKVTVRALVLHRFLRIAVEDEGPGIPRDMVKTIFQPFAQAKGTNTGTGLGLTFCRIAVHAQHGHIWVDPDTEQGTTVWFSIPQPHSAASPASVPLPTEG